MTAPPVSGSPVRAAHPRFPPAQRPVLIALALGFFTVLAAALSRSPAWDGPATLPLLGLGAFALCLAIARGTVEVGDDWLLVRGGLGSGWVRTTRLTRASVRLSLAGARVRLADDERRRLELRLDELTRSPAVWAVFRAALQRSLEHGLQLDPRSRALLEAGPP